MQKAVLERFISKYNLGGTAESVLWVTDGKSLKTRFYADDKNLLGEIKTDELSFDAGEYGIYGTSGLRSFLPSLGENLEILPQVRNGKTVSLLLKDGGSKATFILADPSLIPDVPDLKQLPPWAIEVKLDSEFMTRFVKAKGSTLLADVDTFTVLTDDEGTKIVIGHSERNNTNNWSHVVTLNSGNGVDRPVSFSAQYLREILVANKEAKSGTLSVSDKGLAHVSFEMDQFDVCYYLVEIAKS